MRRCFMVMCALYLASCASAPIASVPALRETAAVSQIGDAADDPAIWVAPDPGQSLVIATQKKGGLYVFDLSGAIVQEVPGGLPNNVDLREAFPWPDGAAPIVGASDRSDNAIVFWRFEADARRLEEAPRLRVQTGFAEVYGFCLGRMGADFIAVASDKDGDIGVWRLAHDGGERIAAFTLSSITEGCVVDDEAGVYYLAEELRGVWRVELAARDGEGRRLVDGASPRRLAADIEGLSIWRATNGGGYLVASAQGRSRFVVYERGGANAYVGMFRIGASHDGSADAVSGTDGIDIVSAPLGPDFPAGLMVAQDDRNTAPQDLQNFKYVSWADITAALGLVTEP